MWKLLPVALVVTLAAVVATACGAEVVDPRTAVAEAAPNTTDAGSSRIQFDMTMTIGGEELSFAGEGEFDYTNRRGRLTYDMSSLAALGDLPAEELGDGRMDMLFDDLVMYMGFPAGSGAAEGLGPGKRWIRFDLAAIGEAAGADLGSLNQFNQNPADQLRLLYAASDNVEEIGTEEVRGVETTRYRAEVDFQRALDVQLEELDLPEEERAALERQLRDLQDQAGLSSIIPMDVWLDDEGRLRRIAMEMAMAVEGEQMGLAMTMELYDFGVEVEFEPPGRGTYVDITDTVLEQTD